MDNETAIAETQEWFEDDNGNRCYVKYFGSTEAAEKALASLIDCKNCINCSGCSVCSRCLDCSDCSGCSGCSVCSGCSRCWGGWGCSGKVGDFAPPNAPKIENIHVAIFDAVSPPAALNMNVWHNYCRTAHCRAGWAVHLAGDAGYALERFHNTELAAQLIYRASGYEISPVRFYESEPVALADMKRLAEGAL